MKRISIDQLKENSVLAKPIYTENGVILIKEGTLLNANFINKISNINIEYVYIEDIDSVIETNEIIVSSLFKQEVADLLFISMGTIRDGYLTVDIKTVNKLEIIAKDIIDKPNIMKYLEDMNRQDSQLLIHSMNVCIVSIVIGEKMGYTDRQLKCLALGALLHDIGKTNVDYNYGDRGNLHKDQAYSKYKEHVRYGYQMMKDIPGVSLLSANIALTHHEKYDGTGFPLGKKNTATHEFARIVALADTYDNLLYEKTESIILQHYGIVEQIILRAYTWFDPEIIKLFRNAISPYPISTQVVLNDGRHGVVVKLNTDFPTRPIIGIKDIKTGLEIERIDLSQNLSLLIVR